MDGNGLFPSTRYGCGSFMYKGFVWLAGGEGVGKSSQVWKFSVNQSKWMNVTPNISRDDIPSNRDGHSVSYIGNGRVLLFGGQGKLVDS